MFSKNSAIKHANIHVLLKFHSVKINNFSQNLKQAKETLVKSKKLDKYYKNNKKVIDKVEENSSKLLYNFSHMFLKLGFLFIILPGTYYYYRGLTSPIYSKKLTDSYNLVMNITMASNCFYSGMLIGYNWAGPFKSKCLMAAGMLYILSIGNTWFVDNMEFRHSLLFLLSFLGLLTFETIMLGSSFPRWYIMTRITISLMNSIIVSSMLILEENKKNEIRDKLKQLDEYNYAFKSERNKIQAEAQN